MSCVLSGPSQLAADLPEVLLESTTGAPADVHIVALLRKHQQAQQQLQAVALQVESVSRSGLALTHCRCWPVSRSSARLLVLCSTIS